MKLQDFLMMMGICLIWSVNVLIGRYVMGSLQVPPIYYAAVRFALVALLLLPFLRPVPKEIRRIIPVGLLIGAAHFGMLFIGLGSATASAASVTMQAGIPFSALFALLILRERLRPRQIAGIVLALGGTLLVIWTPESGRLSTGLLWVLGGASAISLGNVLIRQLKHISPWRLQAWSAAASAPVLALLSGLLETGQWERSVAGGAPFWIALCFSAVMVSIVAQVTLIRLLHRYSVGIVSPLTLAMPLMTVVLGATLADEPLGARFLIGVCIALAGAYFVLFQGRRAAARAAA
ncbi:DMT family transporter [Pseudodonghicola flavimaris]|uniref:DMT family transporter n=1 Tax=Pseudodonghicola flavimaris TaxID=3050036 RepID=A0ABT7F5D5_9RHOB|nr:DMT family transporter [Pseudodonghicola flavimaris]MDK3019821.1 DMT family transporter [Pseudodonghicola flavimaris]